MVRNDDIKIYLDSYLLKMESRRVKTCDFFPGGIDCFRVKPPPFNTFVDAGVIEIAGDGTLDQHTRTHINSPRS